MRDRLHVEGVQPAGDGVGVGERRNPQRLPQKVLRRGRFAGAVDPGEYGDLRTGRAGVMACTGIANPWPDRTFFRTPTIDTSKRGVPPICKAENLLASVNASSNTVSPVSNSPSSARTAIRMA